MKDKLKIQYRKKYKYTEQNTLGSAQLVKQYCICASTIV